MEAQRYLVGLKILVPCLIVLIAFAPLSQTEYFSSIDSIQDLDELELSFLETYRQYLVNQQRELAKYRRFIRTIKLQHKEASDDIEEYLGNPINAFSLIKRLTVDWQHLDNFVNESNAKTELINILKVTNQEIKRPDDRDLRGAAKGLARLQEVYNLSIIDMYDGVINGVGYGTVLTWKDCFEIAASVYEEQEYALAITWFDQFLIILETEVDDADPNKETYFIQSLEYLTLAHFELGQIKEASLYIDDILHIQPNHNFYYYKTYMQLGPINRKATAVDRRLKIDWYSNYTRLCQGVLVPEEVKHNLKCKIDTKNNYNFILAPLKIEELSLEPEISMYHGLLTDGHIRDLVQEAAASNMHRSIFENKVNDTRVSQQAWLKYQRPTPRMLYHLAMDVTGLDMRNAEILQVANYGIGGQFEAHCDTIGLSNVEQGGYTIFPNLNMFVRPVKGSLIVWYNMHRSLDDDNRSMHAGCPVLKGSKRIGNIWIRSGYQEFRRPCELERDNWKSFGYTCNE